MGGSARKFFPFVVLVAGLLAVTWAVSFGTLPKADFSFTNGDKIETVDPSKATGQPEHRVIVGLFEGLLRNLPYGSPTAAGTVAMKPQPGVAAKLPEISADGKVYTFTIRKTARWSKGYGRITAHDFVWSWRRTLHPDTHSKYSYQLYYIQGAEQYNVASVKENGRVEIEFPDRGEALQPFPRGTMTRGILKKIIKPGDPPEKPLKPKKPNSDDDILLQEFRRELAEFKDELKAYEKEFGKWQAKWSYVVEVKNSEGADDNCVVHWDKPGKEQVFFLQDSDEQTPGGATEILRILPDFASTVGVRAEGDDKLIVTLNNPTPFFGALTAFYTLYPVNRKCVEEFGSPLWTKPQNMVSNGPYTLQVRRLRDRVRLVKNPDYWNADKVKIKVIDAFAVNSNSTALNMYIKGQVDWCTDVPKSVIPELKKRDDFVSDLLLSTYFYRLNVTKKPLDNKLIRQALGLAINKQLICERVTKAGEQVARNLVPIMPGYVPAICGEYNPEKAKELLAKAGYPDGKGLPKIEILYNTNDNHRIIAEVISDHWRKTLGIDVGLRNLEWGVYLDSQRELDYVVARAGWVADYPDPNTFLDMFLTGGAQNQTGWGNPDYDKWIAKAARESSPVKRMEHFRKAEAILMDEMPIIPIYFYVSINLVKPKITDFHANILDQHPLHLLGITR